MVGKYGGEVLWGCIDGKHGGKKKKEEKKLCYYPYRLRDSISPVGRIVQAGLITLFTYLW